MPETAPRDHRGKLGVTCTDTSSVVDFALPALTPGIAARSARHPGDIPSSPLENKGRASLPRKAKAACRGLLTSL